MSTPINKFVLSAFVAYLNGGRTQNDLSILIDAIRVADLPVSETVNYLLTI